MLQLLVPVRKSRSVCIQYTRSSMWAQVWHKIWETSSMALQDLRIGALRWQLVRCGAKYY